MDTLQQALDNLHTGNVTEGETEEDELSGAPPLMDYLDQISPGEFTLPNRMDMINEWLGQAAESSPDTEDMASSLEGTSLFRDKTHPSTSGNPRKMDKREPSPETSLTPSDAISSPSTNTTSDRLTPDLGRRETRKRSSTPGEFLYKESKEDHEREKALDKEREKALQRNQSQRRRANKKKRERELDQANAAMTARLEQMKNKCATSKKVMKTLKGEIDRLKRDLKAVQGKTRTCNEVKARKNTQELENQLQQLNKENRALRKEKGKTDSHQKLYHNLERALHLDCDGSWDCPKTYKKESPESPPATRGSYRGRTKRRKLTY